MARRHLLRKSQATRRASRPPCTPALRLVCKDGPLLEELARQPKVKSLLGERIDAVSFRVDASFRGVLKQALITVGYPAEDVAGYTEGAALPTHLRTVARSGLPFHVRDYQREAADVFYAGGDARGGSGVVVLPCGAGKTVVGIAAMALMQRNTLVLTTGVTAVKQWRREILDKTDLTEEQVCEYTGDTKEIGPVTLATYQILTHRNDKTEEFPHFQLFDKRDWGLIIYDEVHLLPAPVFRVTAHIQARRRLGLTATLVREDGREADVFSLIGPKKYDVPWRELETRGWIAEATCAEVRVAMPEPLRMEYAVAEWRDKYRIASENPAKDDVVAALLERYTDSRVLVIGQYLKQLRRLRKQLQPAAHHRPDAEPRARGPVQQVPSRRGASADPVEGRQLRAGPAGRQRADPGVGHVRLASGGGAAAGADLAAEVGRRGGPLLHAGDARHARTGFRAPPPAVPDRAGLQLPHRRQPGADRAVSGGRITRTRGQGEGGQGEKRRPKPLSLSFPCHLSPLLSLSREMEPC